MRKISGLFAVLTLVLTLCSCGGSSPPGPPPPPHLCDCTTGLFCGLADFTTAPGTTSAQSRPTQPYVGQQFRRIQHDVLLIHPRLRWVAAEAGETFRSTHRA